VAGGWKKSHNDELRKLNASPNVTEEIKSRRMRWTEHTTLMGEIKNAYKILIGKSEGKRLLRTPRHTQEDNI